MDKTFFDESGFRDVLKKEIEKRQLERATMRFLGFKREAFAKLSAEFAVYDAAGTVTKVRLDKAECEVTAGNSTSPDREVAAQVLAQWPTA